ncbi:MAG: TonB-dependent receptor [Bacteroidales bacterium]|nr:TonB-dependent receptor [Bacteroidales bacterium]
MKASFQIHNEGFKEVRLDSTILLPRLDAKLSTILSQYSTVFIKSYGANNLATPAFRGTTAHHTIIEWNGININSPMLGQIDLSMLPVAQFQGVEILYGAAGLSRNSGAFGGIINLKTSPDWNNRLNLIVSQTLASFHNYTTTLYTEVGNKNFQSHTRVNINTGKNDFPFYNDYTGQREKLTNGAYTQYGFSEDIFGKINNKHLITARVWYNYSDRDNPPQTVNITPYYAENMKENSFRSLVEYKYIHRKFSGTISSALLYNHLHYMSNTDDTKHQYYSFVNRISGNYTGFDKVTIRPGIDLKYDWVNSEKYTSRKQRNVLGGFIEINYAPADAVTFTLMARNDVVDGELMPFIPAVGVEVKPFRKINLSLSANLSRNYSYPSLNDLYWELWGNPELVPEVNYAAEGGITWNLLNPSKSFFIETELSAYYMLMQDMIVWSPTTTSSLIWKPENISEVLSRGIEAGINSTIVFWKSNLDINVTYNYCRSTYEKETNPNGSSVGKQLIYTPIHTMNASLRFEKRGYYFSYLFHFIGRRYLSKENVEYMPGYNLSNIFLGKSFQMKDFMLSLQLEINNLFGLDYQSIAYSPMPGRNFGITLRGNFKKKSGQ